MRLLVTFLLLSLPIFAQTDAKFISDTVYPATALLYSQDDQGSMKMRCTATAIGREKNVYTFVTAAHCACEDDTDKKTVSPEKTFFFITPDEKDGKTFMKATPTGCGYRHKGDDFALFSVETPRDIPIVKLGKDPEVLDRIANVASPLGLGKQTFLGTISSASLDRPVVENDINWTGVVLVQMFGVNGGSSGSALICLDQKAICGFIVGSIAETSMTAMPVSRLETLRDQLAKGTYKFWVPDPDAIEKK